ncbi:MAG: orotate phosphoribosyltransferase [Bacteroidales bacterium]|nr:orotate phosphoribosyltransferase [Bacteroidales bacterium]
MNNSETKIAASLLQIKAIKLQPSNPFTWASGWKSPIYCDNRKTLSYPAIRSFICDSFVDLIKAKYPEVEVIAGVATGAIAHGMLVADRMNLPFIYVRSSAKEHGLGNQIEGFYQPGQKVVVVEDLISTGGSSLKAVKALREAGCEVLGLVAIFTYQFQKSVDAFVEANCALDTLSNYSVLVDTAVKEDFIKTADMETLKKWRENPEVWGV